MERREFLKTMAWLALGMMAGCNKEKMNTNQKHREGNRKDYTPPFLNPNKEFLIVKHDSLNDPGLNLEELMNDCSALAKYTHGRTVIPAGEGDLFQLPETRELVLTHHSLGEVTQKIFREKRAAGKAAYLSELLEKYTRLAKGDSNQLVLCFELKAPTPDTAITAIPAELSKASLSPGQVYFDSFFGERLDLVSQGYSRSLHLMAKLGSLKISFSPKQGYDLLTVSQPLSFGQPSEPTIYGAVGSVEKIQKAAESPQVLGVYARLKEGNPLKMFMRSVKR